MSSRYEIFLNYSGGSELEYVSKVLKASSMDTSTERHPGTYVYELNDVMIDFAPSHNYEDDYGIPFSDYQIVLTVRDLNSDPENEKSFAERLFRALTTSSQCTGVLVYNLSNIILRS